VKCEYVKTINDVIEMFPLMEKFQEDGQYPLTGAVYIGCYEQEEISSILVWYKNLTHFFVKKEYRKNARDYAIESLKLLPFEELFIKMPKDKKLINFAIKLGFAKIAEENEHVILRKYNG